MSPANKSLVGGRVSRLATVAWCLALLWLNVSIARADTPVTPNAAPEAQALLSYFHDIAGKKILSGQQEGWRGTNKLGFELRHIQEVTGKLPAILGLDAAGMLGDRGSRSAGPSAVVRNAIDWWSNRNGIVTFCWHWSAPVGSRAFYTKDTDFDAARAVTPGTPEYTATLRDLDIVAAQLKLLQAARVPILWRPLHEANGRWFWWGAAGPEPCKKLWRLMFDRFTNQHGLTNLIWVFSPGASIDLADWYPGDAYVDIVGQDHYPMDGNHDSAKPVYDELVALTGGAKLVGMSENGPIPDPALVLKEKAGWFCFVTWGGAELTKHNSPEQLRAFYSQPNVVNLGDLPEWDHYAVTPAGPATKLAFAAAPGDFGIGSPARRPIVVLVQDGEGRTVRSGRHEVTLANPTASGERHPSARTVNGVATFADLTFDAGATGCSLIASAPGLEHATSAKFSIGPGSGILRETWRAVSDTAGTSEPGQQEIVRKAFEVPVRLATNYHARYTAQLVPPQTGGYRFWIANEDESELWLGTDASSETKRKIVAVSRTTPYVKWPHTHEAMSQPVNLVADQRYYLEVLQHQAAGSTHLSVRWQLPDGTEERPIPSARLLLPETTVNNSKPSPAHQP